jgi:hypothetical protein
VKLDEFADNHYDPHGSKVQWCELLPEEVQTQILESQAPHTAVVEWLITTGHIDASRSKVEYFRKTHGWKKATP